MIETVIRSLLGFMVYNEEFDHDAHVKKSKELLREWLSPSQLKEFDKKGCFWVKGSAGGKFCITQASFYNVAWHAPEGVKVLCFTPEGLLPRYDSMLAQKIALETDEDAAVGRSNKRWAQGGDAHNMAVAQGMNNSVRGSYRWNSEDDVEA